MQNGKITDHFSWKEALHSDTAKRLNLTNEPDCKQKAAILKCAQGMEQVRALLCVPIDVTSWFRSAPVNEAVGGTSTSDHMTGHAVDFRARGLNARQAALDIIASDIRFDQLIWYPHQSRLHLGFGDRMRREVKTKPRGRGYLTGLVE